MVPRLEPELADMLAKYRETRAFDPAAWISAKLAAANKFFADAHLTAAVISVSGGVDSAVVAALLCRLRDMPDAALQRVVAVTQPIHSTPAITARAHEVGEALGLAVAEVDQTPIFDALKDVADTAFGIDGGAFASGQLRSYMRTPIAYYAAQLLTQTGMPAVVAGTGNYDEDGYLRYFCKAGDGVVDVALLADLHKSEVFAVGAELGVPQSILCAAPSADLWPGQSDEDELGVSYDFVELWTGRWLQLSDEERDAQRDALPEHARDQLDTWGARIADIHRRNAHKIGFPCCINIFDMPQY